MGSNAQFVYLLAVAFTYQTTSISSNKQDLSPHQTLQRSPSAFQHDDRIRRSANSFGIYENDFLEQLLDQYGIDGMVSMSQLRQLVKNIKVNLGSPGKEVGHKSESDTSPDSPVRAGPGSAGGMGDSALDKINCSDAIGCQSKKKKVRALRRTEKERVVRAGSPPVEACLSMVEIFTHHSLAPLDTVNGSTLQRLFPTILYQLQNPQCGARREERSKKQKPGPAAVWGYGFLCVTLINLCALMGMVFLPLMRRSFYKNMLLFMVALAVGTLAGSGLLFLIPESFEMTAPDSPHSEYYIWRCLTVIGGIYLFFLVERLLKMIMKYKQDDEGTANNVSSIKKVLYNTKSSKERDEMQDLPIASVPTHSVHLEDSMNMSFKPIPASVSGGNKNSDCLISNHSSPTHMSEHANAIGEGDVTVQMRNGQSAQSSPQHHGHSHGNDLRNVRSVAWMVIFGDGLHNFIDGLSIGAAFSGSIMTGFSVSLAVFCEELPHELGDFAILLNSGMTMRQALGYNFLSACMCYLGLIVGTIIGEATTGAVYIFALAGGMFLYISLVDMLPEVNHAADEEEAATGATWSIFFIQNAGLLTGIAIMLLLAVFSGKIDLTHLEQ